MAQQGGGVVGGGVEGEALIAAQPAAVAPLVDGQDPAVAADGVIR